MAEVWKKLGERYGSNVVVTKAHLDKLENFSKIGYRDNKKLQEFGDLLLELQCAKEDGGLQGLKVLDEPIYIKPVLSKLPTDIQTRWQRHAFHYTRDKGVHYPPFSEFSKFIQDVSLERNELNLAIDHPGKDSPPLDLEINNIQRRTRRRSKVLRPSKIATSVTGAFYMKDPTLSASVGPFAPKPSTKERAWSGNIVCVSVALPRALIWQRIVNVLSSAQNVRATDIWPHYTLQNLESLKILRKSVKLKAGSKKTSPKMEYRETHKRKAGRTNK